QGREATTFKTLETEFTLAGGFADFRRIHLINPQMEANGGGTMTLNQPTLDMAIETALSGLALSRAGRQDGNFFQRQSGANRSALKDHRAVGKSSRRSRQRKAAQTRNG